METTAKRLVLNPISKIIPELYLTDNQTVETLILLEGFTEIRRGAFSDCTNLKKVFLPGSLKILGDGAFHGCKSLPKIEIPNSVKTIKFEAFYDCDSLTEIIIDNTEEYVKQNWSRNWDVHCNAKVTYLS